MMHNAWCTVYPKKYAHGFCFAVLCCGYTLTDFPISIRLTSLALWQSNDCPSASKATLMNMDKYFMWSHYEWLHNHNKAKHNKTVCIFLGIYCSIEEVLHCFSMSSMEFQGHTGWKINDLNPVWLSLLGRSQLSNPSDLSCSYMLDVNLQQNSRCCELHRYLKGSIVKFSINF